MKLKSIFNVLLFSFIMIVPLIPIKYKFNMIPMSADFIIGAALILFGLFYIFIKVNREKGIFILLNSVYVKIISIFILLFITISIVSIAYASHRIVAISETIRFLEYVIIFYLVLIIADDITIERCFKVFYFTIVFAAIFGVAQFIFKWSSFTSGGFFGRGRVFSTFVNPNYWGAAINSVIFYPLINLLEDKSKEKNIHIPIFILFFINLFLSSSRAAWLGFVIGVLLICFIRYNRKVLLLFGTIVGIAIMPITRERLLQSTFIKERVELWRTGINMFKDNILSGVGNGNYIFNYERYVDKGIYKPKLSVQNSYIKMLAELGIFGGISFIIMYISIFSLGYRVYKNSSKYKLTALAYVGFGAAYLLQNFFNNLAFIPQLNVFVWILGALLIKGLYLERQGESYGND